MSTLKLKGSTSGEAQITVASSAGTPTITLPTASINLATAGDDGQFLKTNGSGTLSFATAGLFSSYAVICDEKTTGSDGGTFTQGAWQHRDLNTEIMDPDGIVSISSNQFTLGAGTYYFEWAAPGYRCNGHKSRLYDVTGSAVVELGFQAMSDSGNDGDTSYSYGFARDVITSDNTYRIEHRCSATKDNQGFGRSFDIDTERFTYVKIFKEA